MFKFVLPNDDIPNSIAKKGSLWFENSIVKMYNIKRNIGIIITLPYDLQIIFFRKEEYFFLCKKYSIYFELNNLFKLNIEAIIIKPNEKINKYAKGVSLRIE